MTEILPLIYFTHADLKTKENLNVDLELVKTDNDLKKSSFDSKRLSKKIKLHLKDENMSYEALEEDDQPFLIGVLDKKTDKMSVYNTPYFIIKPECYLGSTDKINENPTTCSTTTYSQKLDDLTQAFGSSKKRKAMQTKLKNRIDTETLESAVSVAVEESKLKMKNVDTMDSSDNQIDTNDLEKFSIIPVPNKDAKTPTEVYNINEILCINQAEFERYTMELSTKFATATIENIKKWKELNVYPEYICEHLSIFSNSKSGHHYKILKCKQLAYINFLLNLYRLKSAQLRSKTPLNSSEVPNPIANRILDQYTVVSTSNGQNKNVRSMPRRLKDKLICHILILALFIDDFSTNIDTFQKDLKISVQRIVDFYQALGCFIKSKVTSVNNKKVVSKISTLSIPLNNLKNSNEKKKSRKV